MTWSLNAAEYSHHWLRPPLYSFPWWDSMVSHGQYMFNDANDPFSNAGLIKHRLKVPQYRCNTYRTPSDVSEIPYMWFIYAIYNNCFISFVPCAWRYNSNLPTLLGQPAKWLAFRWHPGWLITGYKVRQPVFVQVQYNTIHSVSKILIWILVLKLIEAQWRIYASANKPPLVQIMACRLDSAKPLSEPMPGYC